MADIVKTVGIPKTSAFRILEVLLSREYVTWNPESEKYAIGLKALEIGLSGLVGQDIVEISIPYCRMPSQQSAGRLLSRGQLRRCGLPVQGRGQSVDCDDRNPGSRRPVLHRTRKSDSGEFADRRIGPDFDRPLEKLTEKTIVDRIRLHEKFAEIRQSGYSVDDEGIEHGLYCLAVPIYNYTGGVVAAISVSGPVKRVTENRQRIIDELKSLGGLISERLGYVKAMKQGLMHRFG